MVPKPGKDLEFPQNVHPSRLLFTARKLFEKVILKIFQRHSEERGLLNASQFGFCVHNNMALQRMRLMDHVTLNVNNNILHLFYFGY
jgi:hypothetical protein